MMRLKTSREAILLQRLERGVVHRYSMKTGKPF